MTQDQIKKDIASHVKKIDDMDLSDLRAFDEQLEESKPLMNSDLYKGIHFAVVAQLAYVMEMSSKKASIMMAENSELKVGEI